MSVVLAEVVRSSLAAALPEVGTAAQPQPWLLARLFSFPLRCAQPDGQEPESPELVACESR